MNDRSVSSLETFSTKSDALNALMTERFSCRSFQPTPVPRETIESILRLAQRTASWTNIQSWQVHIVSGAAMEAFRALMMAAAGEATATPDLPWPGEYRDIYKERRRECGWGLYKTLGIAKGDREASARQSRQNFRFFGAPHVAIITTDSELGIYGAADCGSYLANFMLAATSHGVATVAQAALATRSGTIRDFLKLPESRKVLCGISFGYCDPDHPANGFRTTRAPLDEVVTWVD